VLGFLWGEWFALFEGGGGGAVAGGGEKSVYRVFSQTGVRGGKEKGVGFIGTLPRRMANSILKIGPQTWRRLLQAGNCRRLFPPGR